MPNKTLPFAIGAMATAVMFSPAAVQAQSGGHIDHQRIDARVAAFTGMPAGTAGGAAQPVDRRLRLADCAGPLDLEYYGQRQDMVRVSCSVPERWQIFVPVLRAQAMAASPGAPQAANPVVIERGQVLSIAIEGRGFSVVQQGEALEDGAIGDWIRVRPEGRRDELRARLVTPARAVIPVS